MKTLYKIFTLILAVSVLGACEKNDPLAEQGQLTGNIVPFNLLAQMPDAAPGDTLTLRTVTWAVDDDIESVSFYHKGFKLLDYEVRLRIAHNDQVYEPRVNYLADSVKFEAVRIASYPESGKVMNDYYQTFDNAYVVVHDFIVPQPYALVRTSGEELINAMGDGTFGNIVSKFSDVINRNMMVALFPEINAFSLTYFEVDDSGFYTGNITEAGKEYIRENMDRELMVEFLRDATVADNTRVTIESESTLEVTAASTISQRTFRVL